MYSAFFAPALALGSILGILAMLEWGRYLGKRALAADGEAARVGVTVIEGAVYALTGLLIAFTFGLVGIAGFSADTRNEEVYEQNESAFATGNVEEFAEVANSLENTAAATHTRW